MSQATVNKKWKQKFQSNVGEIEMLVPPKKRTALKKPYEFVATIAEVAALVKDVKAIVMPYRKGRLQCDLLETKAVSCGVRFGLFLLGYKPGYCGTPDGISAADWRAVTDAIKKRIKKTLKGCEIYVDAWRTGRKFQLRCDTYIMYKEMENL